jgi:membrane complex biogenesis BtpA family protein
MQTDRTNLRKLLPRSGDDARPLLIGVVHLAPLPGSPRYAGAMHSILERAEADASAFARGGADAICVENFGDVPFRAEQVDPETIAAMALAVERVADAAPTLAIGVNVLRNDARAGLGLCAATRAGFLRVNVHSGAAVTDQGLVEGRADQTLRERRRLGLDCVLLADVHVKHAAPLGSSEIGDAAEDAVRRGLADGLIVSGRATGSPVAPDDLAAVRRRLPEVPLLVGSGLEPGSASAIRGLIDGAFVGTWTKAGGRIEAPVDPDRVAALRAALGD